MNCFDEDLINELNIRNICFDILSEAAHTAIVNNINEKISFFREQTGLEKIKNQYLLRKRPIRLVIFKVSRRN